MKLHKTWHEAWFTSSLCLLIYSLCLLRFFFMSVEVEIVHITEDDVDDGISITIDNMNGSFINS